MDNLCLPLKTPELLRQRRERLQREANWRAVEPDYADEAEAGDEAPEAAAGER